MKSIVLLALLTVFVIPRAYCQVDTLEFLEIGSLSLPAPITNLYVEDLNLDSLKEIILTDSNYIYLYDYTGQTLLWQSQELGRPRDLCFGDLNGDGLIDISAREASNIYLFDPHHSTIIWTSPQLDSTYSCYTIGDVNSDSTSDFVLVIKEPFTRPEIQGNRDTVWVSLYIAPAFTPGEEYEVTMSNYFVSSSFGYSDRVEKPKYVSVMTISGYGGVRPTIIIQSSSSYGYSGFGPDHSTLSGGLWVNDAQDYSGYVLENRGSTLSLVPMDYNGMDMALSINFIRFFISLQFMETDDWIVNIITADSLVASSNLYHFSGPQWSLTDWTGYVYGDLDSSQPGQELCYGLRDSLVQISVSTLTPVWVAVTPTNIVSQQVYHSPESPSQPLIIVTAYTPSVRYNFIDGTSGNIRATIPENLKVISLIRDINNDGIDEILSVQNQGGVLETYTLIPATGVDDGNVLPLKTFLSQNYPNPFNAQTCISFNLVQSGNVTLEIFDLLGRKIDVLHEGLLPAGEHKIVWDAAGRTSGIYFYRLSAGEFSQSRLMTLLK